MGKNPAEKDEAVPDGSKMKKILHGEMIDRGILLSEKKKKSSKRRVSHFIFRKIDHFRYFDCYI